MNLAGGNATVKKPKELFLWKMLPLAVQMGGLGRQFLCKWPAEIGNCLI